MVNYQIQKLLSNNPTPRKRYASYTALSEAHSDVFLDGLYGPNPDKVQQTNFKWEKMYKILKTKFRK